jgi:deoxycytidylate deaminase
MAISKSNDPLDRDEKDIQNKHGQQVRDAFHHADYFLDNNEKSAGAVRVSGDLKRFVKLILTKGLVRPTREETGMFYAQAAALRSSCLSRQVGAALQGEFSKSGGNHTGFGAARCRMRSGK